MRLREVSGGCGKRRPLWSRQSLGMRCRATAFTYYRCSGEPVVVGDGVGGLAMYSN
jgi:hypothetical protein